LVNETENKEGTAILKKILLFIVLLFCTAGIGLLCWFFWWLRGYYETSNMKIKKLPRTTVINSNIKNQKSGIASAR
jgi:hypothetical protein